MSEQQPGKGKQQGKGGGKSRGKGDAFVTAIHPPAEGCPR